MMTRLFVLGALALALGAVGCGSDSGNTGDTETDDQEVDDLEGKADGISRPAGTYSNPQADSNQLFLFTIKSDKTYHAEWGNVQCRGAADCDWNILDGTYKYTKSKARRFVKLYVSSSTKIQMSLEYKLLGSSLSLARITPPKTSWYTMNRAENGWCASNNDCNQQPPYSSCADGTRCTEGQCFCGSGPTSTFEKFTLDKGAGPCMDDMDCRAFIELNADGKLRVDRFSEMPVVVHEATVSQEDLQAAIQALTASDLIQLLDLGKPPCQEPTDVFESMHLLMGGTEHTNSTTFCQLAPLVTARDTLQNLADKYLSPKFESFKITRSAGPCPDGMDCRAFIELTAAGQLRVDKFEDPSQKVYEANVTQEELANAIKVLTTAELLNLLDMTSPPCNPPTDVYEGMELVMDGVKHDNSTTSCDDEPLEAARSSLNGLADKYAP